MTRVVFAPDSFKGSVTAASAATALAAGWISVRGDVTAVLRPMADGGEGTLAAFEAAVAGARRMPVTVPGPRGDPVDTAWVLLPDRTGVVELASTSGIELLGDERLPWDADTLGFGQAIAAALDHGVSRIVLGIGSSASTDCGIGVLTALGARILDATGEPVARGARGLLAVSDVDLSGLRSVPPDGVVVLCDVVNPLTGPNGAAHVFGPQKGFDAQDLPGTDAALARFADAVRRDPTTPGSGAAGGTGFAMHAWGAQLTPGAAEVAELIGLHDAIIGADLVVTGEGAFDGQSAGGKVPSFVTRLAAECTVSAALVAGQISPEADLSAYAAALSLTAIAGDANTSLANPERWLRAAGATLARAF
ncbi:glycerate kinase [Microbacterium immunditiarum]|uniref:Glycerate kinase n=1 Tax=Microbacterium immunditiarum TaxID=337480 RepID=A0A7Y9KMQ1_9MICO|nr:glycerate kinase [Microbacterium immunditiarum]